MFLRSESGRYTCSPSNTEPAHVALHIVDGKKKRPHAFRLAVADCNTLGGRKTGYGK